MLSPTFAFEWWLYFAECGLFGRGGTSLWDLLTSPKVAYTCLFIPFFRSRLCLFDLPRHPTIDLHLSPSPTIPHRITKYYRTGWKGCALVGSPLYVALNKKHIYTLLHYCMP